MDFNTDTFVERYTAALKAGDQAVIASLISSLDGDEQRTTALAAVITAIKSDEDLLAKAGETLELLEAVQEINKEGGLEATGADVEVAAPSIKQEAPATEEA